MRLRAALALGLAMAAMTTPAEANERWRVVSVDGRAVTTGQEATIELSRNRMSGKSFCNRYSVEIQMIRGTRIVGEAAATRMACAPALMALESRFLGLITPSSTMRIERGQLIIRGANGGVIRARRG
jgi:heat shock protein HslJ